MKHNFEEAIEITITKKFTITHYEIGRRKLYHTRNKKYLNTPNTCAYYASRLLW